MTKYSYVLFFLILINYVSAQIIRGKIFDEEKEIISNGFLLLSNKEATNKTLHFQQIKNGNFSLDLTPYENDLVLIIKSNGFVNDTIFINKKELQNSELLFFLKRNQPVLLEEVKIKAKKYPFKIKNDTVSYKVSSYSDGSDIKLEDVLKKLPGIEVNSSTGSIKYKGKAIETIMIEGDNLFGSDYIIGSKNINTDLVDEIEAIDNYSENPLLKGLDDKEKVALNLKLKKGLLSISGDVDLGLGAINEEKAAKDIAATTLVISKGVKAFNVLSNNNIGKNRSSINYYSNNEDFSKKIITDHFPINQINKDYNFTNDQYLSDLNMIFKLNSKLAFKINSSIIDDSVFFSQYNFNSYNILNEQFLNEDLFSTSKKNLLFKNNLKLNYKFSTNSNIEYDFTVLNNDLRTENRVESNGSLINDYTTRSKVNLFKNNLLYTNKIDIRNVIQISIKNSANSVKQDLNYMPAVLNIENDLEQQKSNFSRESTTFETKLYTRNQNENEKFSVSFAFAKDKTVLNSDRKGYNSDEIYNYLEFRNRTIYNVNDFYNVGKYTISKKKWKTSFDYKISMFSQDISYLDMEAKHLQDTDFIFELNSLISYNLNKTTNVSATANLKQSPVIEDFLFFNQVLTDNRVSVSSLLNLNLSKSYNFQLQYFKNDMYNQFLNTITISYQKSQGNMLSETLINDNFINTKYMFNGLSNDIIDFNFMVSKFIPFLNSTIKLNSIYNYSTNNNVVNNSDIRRNVNHFLENELFFKTSFPKAINFENSFIYRLNNSNNEEGESFINEALNNQFKTIFKINTNFLSTLDYVYFIPDNKNLSNNYNFIDFTFRYLSKNKKNTVSFVVNNLLNKKSFSTIQTSDVSINIMSTSIISRHFLLKYVFKF